jgi:hypothetical protein
LYRQEGRPLLASHAQELVLEVAERACWMGVDARMDAESLRHAWQQRFAEQMK